MYKPLKKLTEAVQAKLRVSGQNDAPVSPIGRDSQDSEEEEQRFNAEFRRTLVELEKKSIRQKTLL